MKKIDVAETRGAFEHAIEHHSQEFGAFFLAKLLGFDITYDGDHCVVTFPARDFMFNPQGSLHGGVIALAMDVSMGHLLKHVRGAGATLEMRIQYLRPVLSGTVTATGSFLRQGGSINFLESRLTNDDGELVAVATSTWKLLREVR